MEEITKIEVKKYDLSLLEPFKISLGTLTKAKNVLVKVFTDDYIGIGEGAPTPIITGDTQDGSLSFIKDISSLLINEEFLDMQVLNEKIGRSCTGMTSAKAALNIALYDLIGKYFSSPLYKILGGYRKKIETDITIGINTPENVKAKALDAISKGYKTLKIKIGTDVNKDFERVETLSDLGIKIRLDANQGYTPKSAVKFIRRLKKFDIEFVEQPVPSWDLEGMKYVKENSEIPIIADESIHSARDALKFINYNAVDGINIKLMKCGGISNAIEIVHIAETAGIPCMIGCMLESKISVTAAAHLALAFKNIKYVDLDSHLFLKDDPTSGGIVIRDGVIYPPKKSGLGIETKQDI